MATKGFARAGTTAARPTYRCRECGWATVKWAGRCGQCQAWGTIEDAQASAGGTGRTAPRSDLAGPAQLIEAVDATPAAAASTGVAEFDRVLGGGLVRGSVALVAGEPGIGKSTLLLDLAARAGRAGVRVLYVSAEESAAQIRLRAERIGAIADNLYLIAQTDLATILGHLESHRPQLLIVDSVQTVTSAEVDGGAGSVSQVREVAACLIHAAKTNGMSTLLVGHVTKDGSIAGPRALEHLVDVVIQFEGDRHSRLRLVRAVKNRYGPTDEVGCFELTERGIEGLADPSGLFRSGGDRQVPGTAVAVALEGRRPLVCEVQALLARTSASTPRRTCSGVDPARVAMLMAVLQRHVGVRVLDQDCYVSTIGGARTTEPASDVAIALAMASSAGDLVLPQGLLAAGEVGLSGEIRHVPGLSRRLAEAARLGFTCALIPHGDLDDPPPRGLTVEPIRDLVDAVVILAAPKTRRLRIG